jgi:hypothetical protein
MDAIIGGIKVGEYMLLEMPLCFDCRTVILETALEMASTYECPTCGEDFKTLAGLRTHMRVHDPNRYEPLTAEERKKRCRARSDAWYERKKLDPEWVAEQRRKGREYGRKKAREKAIAALEQIGRGDIIIKTKDRPYTGHPKGAVPRIFTEKQLKTIAVMRENKHGIKRIGSAMEMGISTVYNAVEIIKQGGFRCKKCRGALLAKKHMVAHLWFEHRIPQEAASEYMEEIRYA